MRENLWLKPKKGAEERKRRIHDWFNRVKVQLHWSRIVKMAAA